MDKRVKETRVLETQPPLNALKPEHSFFVGVDSDGCVFDTMYNKQVECFLPALIDHFELHAISEYVKETWEFVTLKSKQRGANRFIALVETFRLLEKRPELEGYREILTDLTPVDAWIKVETKLGNPALRSYAAAKQDPVIEKTLAWSLDANERMVRNAARVQPFVGVRSSLEKIRAKADVVVISQCSAVVLGKEWNDHGMDTWVHAIAGQEYGSKAEQLASMALNKYPSSHILMIGDAPGDKMAAENNGVLFYPIMPGGENESWKYFEEVAFERFLHGLYAGDYQENLVEKFENQMAVRPPWKQKH